MELHLGDKSAARMLLLCIQLPVSSTSYSFIYEYLFTLYLSDSILMIHIDLSMP